MFSRDLPILILLVLGAMLGSSHAGARTTPVGALVLAASTFANHDEGWRVVAPARSRSWAPTHSPEGALVAGGEGSEDLWYWEAPESFLGDRAAAYEGTLNFHLRAEGPGALLPVLPLPASGTGRRERTVAVQAVEQALAEMVSEFRVVEIRLSTGGEVQLCLRVDPELAARGAEIASLREALRARAGWKKQLELAELCRHSGRWEEAREAYRTVLAARPHCFPAALELGAMLRQEGREPEAAEVYAAALAQRPPPLLAARLRGYLFLARGEAEAAATAFREAIAQDPRTPETYRGLHAALARLSRYEEQLANLARLREVAPLEPFGYAAVYTPCARLERFDLARPLLEEAVRLDPNNPTAIKFLFQVRMNLGLLDAETGALAERLVHLQPDLYSSWVELAWFYREIGHVEEAVAVQHRFLEEHPDSAQAHAALAWTYYYLGRHDRQFHHASRAYSLEPNDPHVCWSMIQACKLPATPVMEEEACRYAREIAARFPEDAFLLGQISFLYADWGREEEAIACARRAVEMSSTADTRTVLAELHAELGRWQEAERLYSELCEEPEYRTHPRWCAWLAHRARALASLGDERAEAAFQEALAAAHGDREQAFLFELLERREEAIAAHRRCLHRWPHTAARGLRRLGAKAE